jgi:UDP-2,3-diacylglucosamine pyrophosphatase LpxH
MTHDEFLELLLKPFAENVFLAGHYADRDLGIEDDVLRIFIPDLHWMSRATLARFSRGYEFNPGTLPDGRPLFGTLLDVLEDCKDALKDEMEIYQLGDSFDLWREMWDANGDVASAFSRVRLDPIVRPLADRLVALDTKFVRGNHDAWLVGVPHQLTLADEYVAAGSCIRLVHGHRFDNIEALLPDAAQAFVVQLAQSVKPRKLRIGPFSRGAMKRINGRNALRRKPGFPKALTPLVESEGAIRVRSGADVTSLLETWHFHLNVGGFRHGAGAANDFELIDYLSFGDDIYRHEAGSFEDHTLYVIGHTHQARILVDRSPASNKPLVTMDCGAWVEKCFVKQSAKAAPDVTLSGQFGVQLGNEIRLYQLGGGV